MPVYVSLLRGINVAGNKVILMADLKKVFEKAGFKQVETYIQSGNVVFSSVKGKSAGLEEIIKSAIRSRFKFEVEILVLMLDELQNIIRKNPFAGDQLELGERIYLTILSQKPTKERISDLHKIKNNSDGLEIMGRTVYVLCRKGYAKSPFNNNSIEKVLKVYATSRNLETMTKLVEIGKGMKT